MDAMAFALPPTPRQISYARSLAQKNQTLLPWDVQQDRRRLSVWIDAQAQLTPVSALDPRPTSKQVAHSDLGYWPPAPKSIVPIDQRLTMH